MFNELYDNVFNCNSTLPPRLLGYERLDVIQIIEDFPLPEIGNIIILSKKTYFIDGDIDFTGFIFDCSAGPVFTGTHQNISVLRSSENDITAFSGGGNSTAFVGLRLSVTGTNSKLFNLVDPTNQSILRFNNILIEEATEIGIIKGWLLTVINIVDIRNISQGLTFDGIVNGAILIDNVRVRNSTGIFFNFLPGLVMNGRLAISVDLDVPSGSTGIIGSLASFIADGSFKLNESLLFGDGTRISGIPQGSTKALFTDNFGILNSDVGGEWCNQSVQATPIGFINTYTDLIVDTPGGVKFLVWVSEAAGVWTYLSAAPLKFSITVVLYLTGTNNNTAIIGVDHFIADGATNEIVAEGSTTLNGAGGGDRPATVVLTTTVILKQNDKIKLRVKNQTTTNTINTLASSNMILTAII